jgi:peptidoglycan hydrolase CwlO-like protein
MLAIIITFNNNVGNALAAQPSNNDDALKQTQEDKKNIQNKIQDLDGKIQDVLKKVDNNKKDMNKLNTDMESNQKKLDATKNTLNSQQNLFNKRLRAMYMNGTNSYLNILFSSKSFNDFASKANAIGKVIEFDKNVIGNVKGEKEDISKTQQSLNDENQKLLALKKDNEQMLLSLNKNVGQQKDLLAKTTQKEQNLLAEKAAEEQRQKELQAAAAAAAAANANKANKANSANNSKALLASPSSQPPAVSGSVISLEATGYSDDGLTSLGTPTVRNPNGYSTVAVDPRVIRPGARLYVDGYGYAVADDTGGDIIGNRIDLFFSSKQDALNWGRRTVTVHILN